MSKPPVPAVRAGVADFLLTAEEVHEGLEFIVNGAVYVVESSPRIVATDRYMAQVRKVAGGPGTFAALLRVGKLVD